MKPSRRIFQLALERLQVSAQHAVFVGDRVDNDIKGAARVGMRTVLLLHGDRAPARTARPDYTVRRLGEVTGIVKQQGP